MSKQHAFELSRPKVLAGIGAIGVAFHAEGDRHNSGSGSPCGFGDEPENGSGENGEGGS